MQLVAAGYLKMKTDRAKLHLDALNRQIDLFLKAPYTVIRRDDLEKRRHIRRTEMKANDPIIGMLLGEFLYCLRSGLDQMAWQLALPEARAKHPRTICFPIYDEITSTNSRRNYDKIRKCFSDPVMQEIDALQPYKRLPTPPEVDLLWQLNRLCNIDKHMLIPLHSRSAPVFVPHHPEVLMQHFDAEDAIEVSVPIEDKHHLDFEPEPISHIEIGEWESDWVIPRERLGEIYDFVVNKILPTFAKFRFSAVTATPLRFTDMKTIYNA